MLLLLQLILFVLVLLPLDFAFANTPVGSWSFDEGGGTVVTDSSGFGNDGTLYGSPTWTVGISGSALDLGGGIDRVIVSDSSSLDVTNTITLACWIKPRKKTTQYVVKKARYGDSDGYELSLSSGGQVFVRFNQASSGNDYKLYSQSYYPTDGNTWMHIAATHDGQEIKLYIDGVLESSSSAAGLVIGTNDVDLAIGAQDDGLAPFQGVIDQVHLYSYALSATDIQDLVAPENNITDTDGDGVPDDQDAFPNDPNEWLDTDGDGTGNNADIDDDDDGMPDDWEILYGFNPLDTVDAAEDADEDGVSNLDEFLQGTNPRDNLVFGDVGSWSFDEGGGTIVTDSSGFGNDGTLYGSPTWTVGISGSALDLGGGIDRVIVSDSSSLDVTNTITLACWIKPRKKTTQYVVKKARYGDSDGYELSLSSGGQVFVRFNQASSGNDYKLYSQSYYPTDGNTWMHIAASYDGQEIKFYVDGLLESSLFVPGLVIGSNDHDLSIGAQDDAVNPFKGVIDQVHLYNYPLSATDIQDLVASENNITDTDDDGMPDDWEILYGFNPLDPVDAAEDADGDGVSNLDEFLQGTNPRDNLVFGDVGNWSFDEGSGTIAGDLSGNDHTGYLVNGPTWVDGRLGKALLFDESLEQRVFIGDSPALNMGSTSFSIVFWLKYNTCLDTDVLRKGSTTTANDWYKIEVINNKIGFNLNTDLNTASLTAPSSNNDDAWHHVAAIRDIENNLMRLYIDGTQVASRRNPPGSVSNSANFVIASKDTENDDFFNGSLDNIAIYSKALSSGEVLYLFNAPTTNGP
jgi:hypothetical protein